MLNYLSKKRHFSGEISLYYCVWYGFERSIVENLRTDSLMIGNIRVSVLVSVIICLSAAAVLIVMRKKQKTTAGDSNYSPMFDNDEPLEITQESEEETDE